MFLPYFKRRWRNWQTHYLEVVAGQPVGVRVPPFAFHRTRSCPVFLTSFFFWEMLLEYDISILGNQEVTSVMRTQKHSYDNDFYGWVLSQANLLKQGEYQKVDWDNVIEEFESLGKSEKRTLESQLTNLLMHMLKVKYQPEMHTRSWDLSIEESRFQANKSLKENPSLKPKLADLLEDAYYAAVIRASKETVLDKKIFPKKCPWTLKEILK